MTNPPEPMTATMAVVAAAQRLTNLQDVDEVFWAEYGRLRDAMDSLTYTLERLLWPSDGPLP